MKRALLSATALALVGQFFQASDAVASGFMVREHSAEGLATSYAGDGSRAAMRSPAALASCTTMPSGDRQYVPARVVSTRW